MVLQVNTSIFYKTKIPLSVDSILLRIEDRELQDRMFRKPSATTSSEQMVDLWCY